MLVLNLADTMRTRLRSHVAKLNLLRNVSWHYLQLHCVVRAYAVDLLSDSYQSMVKLMVKWKQACRAQDLCPRRP